jgi:hypothetical protein
LKLGTILALAICALTTAGCGQGMDKAEEALRLFEQALKTLERESQSWQGTLKALEEKLAGDIQDTLRYEVSQVLGRTVQAVGTEFRCTADFLGHRVRDRVRAITEALRAFVELRKKDPAARFELPPRAPVYCDAVPDVVDLRNPHPDRITLSGYDMDVAGSERSLRILLYDEDGSSEDVSKYIAVVTHYKSTVNISPAGVPFRPTSDQLRLYWAGRLLSTFNIARNRVPFPVKVFTSVSSADRHPEWETKVPDDHRLVGGGCRVDLAERVAGLLLTGSYPDLANNRWICRAKEHKAIYSATVTAFAIGIPVRIPVELIEVTKQGEVGDLSSATAAVPSGYTLVGGGCESSYRFATNPFGGKYVVDSYPVTAGWQCQTKAHDGIGSGEPAIAHALGMKSDLVRAFVQASVVSALDGWPKAEIALADPASLIGGGCDVTYTGAGNMLFAAYPTSNTFYCRSKDHGATDPGQVVASGIALDWARYYTRESQAAARR